MSESHSFSVSVAEQVGVIGAILLQHFHFLNREAAKNNNTDFASAPVSRSVAALASTYSYLTIKQIRTEVDKLEETGVIQSIKGGGYDRTKSYFVTTSGLFLMKNGHLPKRANAFAQKVKSICPNGQFHLPKRAIPFAQTGDSYKVGYNYCNNSYSLLYSALEKNKENNVSFSKKTEDQKAPPTPAAPPVTPVIVDDLTNAIDVSTKFVKENIEQVSYWFNIAKITGWTTERTVQEIAAFFSYYQREKESSMHQCRRDPLSFFKNGFLGWLIKCDKSTGGGKDGNNYQQNKQKTAINTAPQINRTQIQDF
jgi:hypothetical protein